MDRLDNYPIQQAYLDKILANVKNSEFHANIRKDKDAYIHASRAMIWLEEQEQSKILKEFNQTNIRLENTGKDDIFIVKDTVI